MFRYCLATAGIVWAVGSAQGATSVRILLGVGDRAEKIWDGEVTARGARITAVEPWRFDSNDAMLPGNGWKMTTHGPGLGGHISISGPRIEGGVNRRVVKGDVIIIPGGTPHWWSNLEGDITYLIVCPDPESTIPLK